VGDLSNLVYAEAGAHSVMMMRLDHDAYSLAGPVVNYLSPD